MVSALVSGSSGPGSRPGRGHCVVLTYNFYCFYNKLRHHDDICPHESTHKLVVLACMLSSCVMK